jgi:hypothetical protein
MNNTVYRSKGSLSVLVEGGANHILDLKNLKNLLRVATLIMCKFEDACTDRQRDM